ncbi:fatty acid alpha-hydroxylase ASCRUDRAFT_28984 [Ascoidea rubescens DSM 1968]|uniref:Ceramide very long chain fatty acid hydroxylase n=1 Tax=Ascoidea rubescens DSM 1968 TaxID=1344418 RepID=A0A1D2VPK5_9ASCO|nr:putative membrane protein [Ascoidea rubescens DSM 1968]ODV63487.1 putative membrane protein [Ascoidea rubescens DSM 1968]
MSKILPLITLFQLSTHNNKKSCWVSLYHRKIYDVTQFLDEHPAGSQLILDYAGKDVTSIMSDIMSHEHSESSYEILDENYLVGYLATPEEQNQLLSNPNHHVEVKLSDPNHPSYNYVYDYSTSNCNSDFDSTHFQELPTYDKLSIQTDYSSDYKKHKFLDLNKPLLLQVLYGHFSKDFYLDQVHRPRHYGKGSAPLFGNFLEPLSLTPWWIVPTLWLPVDFYILSIALANLPLYYSLSMFALGLFIWTLIEYCMHRFLFHLDHYLPNNSLAFMIHFLLHGVHHFLPMDKQRLVMPPTLFVALCFPFYKLIFSIFPYYIACAAFSGGFLGYIIYDVCHYSLHHVGLPKYLQELKKYHLEHHYKNYELGFGVTSKFWDKIFNTELTPNSAVEKNN